MTPNASCSKWSKISVAVFILTAFSISLSGQEAAKASPPSAGFVDDWSHHHLVFSNPGAREDAEKNGTLAKWLSVTNSTRFKMQQSKRNIGPRPIVSGAVSRFGGDSSIGGGHIRPISPPTRRNPVPQIEKDWSVPLGSGSSGNPLTITITSPGSGTVGSTSSFTVDGQAFQASAPGAASGRGTFTGNPTTGQHVTIGGLSLLASDSTAATATVTIGATTCFQPTGSGITLQGTTITTNATKGATNTYIVNSQPANADTVVIGGVTYHFETSLSGTPPANSVLIGSSTANTSRNLSVAVAGGAGTCGNGSPCTNATTPNPLVSSTNNTSTTTQTMTDLCANNPAITNTGDGVHVTVNNLVAGTVGSTNATFHTFALGTTNGTTSNTTIAAAINTIINTGGTFDTTFTSAAPSNVVTISALTWGSAGNADTLVLDGTPTGLTLGTFAALATGTNGTTDSGHFAVVNSDSGNAANLVAAITAANNGVVSATHTGTNAYATITAVTPGTSGNSIALGATGVTGFSWQASTLGSGTNGVAGTDGTTSGTNRTFAYWSGNTYLSQNSLATNIATATGTNATVAGNMTVAQGTGSNANRVTYTPITIGTFTASESGFSALSGTGTFGGGTSAQVQPNAYPAKYGASFTTANCTDDFVVYPTGQTGAVGATIIAYNALYSGCGGTVPSTLWAYDTGASAAVTTSPVLSEDGSQVAFVQSDGTTASLVVLKWDATSGGTITSPISPQLSTDISTCTAPCMTVTSLGANDTYSAPFYTYVGDFGTGADTVIVGTDSGTLLKVSPVFGAGTPTVSSPVSLNGIGSATPVASPVYDVTSGCVFVGDIAGYLYSVDAGFLVHGTTCNSGTFKLFGHSADLGHTGGNYGMYDSPIVDSSAGGVYAFVAQSATLGNCTSHYNCIDEYLTAPTGTGAIISGSTTAAPLAHENAGVGGATGGPVYPFYSGDFDNTYYSSPNGTGSLYVVGGTGTATAATLFRATIGTNNMTAIASSVTGLTGTAGFPWPSPATEFFNANSGIDYLFFSVNDGAKSGCTNSDGNGCILSYNITTTTPTLSGTGGNYTTPGTNGCYATGGIVIDNDDATGGSNIYFVSLNGSTAGGGVSGDSPTTAGCTAGGTGTINAIQGLQSNP